MQNNSLLAVNTLLAVFKQAKSECRRNSELCSHFISRATRSVHTMLLRRSLLVLMLASCAFCQDENVIESWEETVEEETTWSTTFDSLTTEAADDTTTAITTNQETSIAADTEEPSTFTTSDLTTDWSSSGNADGVTDSVNVVTMETVRDIIGESLSSIIGSTTEESETETSTEPTTRTYRSTTTAKPVDYLDDWLMRRIHKRQNDCCDIGKSLYTTVNGNCSMIHYAPRDVVTPGRDGEDRMCIATMAMCCIEHMWRQKCEEGMRIAEEHLTCAVNQASEVGTHLATQICCTSCILGYRSAFVFASLQHYYDDGEMLYSSHARFVAKSFGHQYMHPFIQCYKDRIFRAKAYMFGKGQNMDIDKQLVDSIQISANSSSSSTNSTDNTIAFEQPDKGEEEDEIVIPKETLVNVTSLLSSLPCPPGFAKDENGTCFDIDECAMRRANCSAGFRCENSIGSFICRRDLPCGMGYTLLMESQNCVDYDECKLGIHNCRPYQVCNNMAGSFYCVTKPCPLNHRRNETSGECYYVQCKPGFDFDNKTLNCIDRDECTQGSRVTFNTTELYNVTDEDNNTVSLQNVTFYEAIEPVCVDMRCINLVGSYRCEVAPKCKAGMILTPDRSRCVDINECEGNHTCTGLAEFCVNIIGSYSCNCHLGYRQTNAGCVDINECPSNPCKPTAGTCVNLEGSYDCDCFKGYQKVQQNRTISPGIIQQRPTCEDANECELGKCPPPGTCMNTEGSFHCECPFGYERSTLDTCDDINECNGTIKLCDYDCVNTPGSYQCACSSGFAPVGRRCEDVNECLSPTTNACGSNEICVNTRGSYKCPQVVCPESMSLRVVSGSMRCDWNVAEYNHSRQPMWMSYQFKVYYFGKARSSFLQTVSLSSDIEKMFDIREVNFTTHLRYPSADTLLANNQTLGEALVNLSSSFTIDINTRGPHLQWIVKLVSAPFAQNFKILKVPDLEILVWATAHLTPKRWVFEQMPNSPLLKSNAVQTTKIYFFLLNEP